MFSACPHRGRTWDTKARNANGDSAYSNVASLTTP